MRKKTTLVHPDETFHVPCQLLIQKCDLFINNPMLMSSPYALKSQVSHSVVCEFLSALQGNAITITRNNLMGLSFLCEELGFGDLTAQLSQFRNCDDFKKEPTMEDSEARMRLSAVEERMQHCDRKFAALQAELSRQFRTQESAVNAVIGRVVDLESEVLPLRTGRVRAAAAPRAPALSFAPSSVPEQAQKLIPPPASAFLPPPTWNSASVSDFPEIFAEFRGQQFSLLWRGSRDGFRDFRARDFHVRCDGHSNTLTVILDTNRNIFGGFTPVEWESREWNGKFRSENSCSKADPSLKSFLFTIKNPHNVPARRFTLKPETKDEAIYCDSKWGPHFWDIHVSDNCNSNVLSHTYYFGDNYTNNTGQDGSTFFTGSKWFKVKEIEVFEITD
jgi:hypothetical protein